MSSISSQLKPAKPAERLVTKVLLVSLSVPKAGVPENRLSDVICCEPGELEDRIRAMRSGSVWGKRSESPEQEVSLKIFALDGLIPGTRTSVRLLAERLKAELVFTDSKRLPEQLKKFFEKPAATPILKIKPLLSPPVISPIEDIRQFVEANTSRDVLMNDDLWSHALHLVEQAKTTGMELSPRSIHAVLTSLRRRLKKEVLLSLIE